MIHFIHQEIEILKNTQTMLNELNSKKDTLSNKEYNTEYKKIEKYLQKELKTIRKKYNEKKLIQEFLKDNNNE